MIEFVRGVLRGMFKCVAYIAGSGLAAGIVATNFASPSDFNVVFYCSWAVIALLLFTFPEILKWLVTPL